MEFKKLLPVAAVAFSGGAIGGCEKPVATDFSCIEVAEDSRPVEGACLEDKYADLDALRKKCGKEVTTVIKGCDCGGTEAPVWTCEGDE